MFVILLFFLWFLPALSADKDIRLQDIQKQAAQLEKKTPAPSSLSGLMIKIQCSDESEPSEYRSELALYSTTIKNMVDDNIHTQGALPLHNVTKKTFDGLMGFIGMLHSNNDRLPNIRKTFQETLPDGVSTFDLLMGANYLDINKDITESNASAEEASSDTKQNRISFKSAIASLHADFLKNNAPKLKSTDDALPVELEPLVAGWLLHDLLEEQNPMEVNTPYDFDKKTHIHSWNSTISNSAPSNNVIFAFSINNDENFLLVNLLQEKLEKKTLKSMLQPNSRLNDFFIECSISPDKQWICIIVLRGFGTNERRQHYALVYDLLSKETAIVPKLFHLTSGSSYIRATWFNQKDNTFDIIEETYDETTKQVNESLFHQISPIDGTQTKKTIHFDSVATIKLQNDDTFSYINGNVFRTSLSTAKDTILKYDKNIALPYTLNQNGDYYFNTKEAPYSVIKINIRKEIFAYLQYKKSDATYDYYVIQKSSLIPNFAQIIEKKLNTSAEKIKPFITKPIDTAYPKTILVDTNNLHITLLDNDQRGICIYYPCDPQLLESINFLNKEVINNNRQNILLTAWLIYQMHTNQTDWAERWKECTKDIPEDLLYAGKDALIPEAIQEIYKIGRKTASTIPTTTATPEIRVSSTMSPTQNTAVDAKPTPQPKPTSFWANYAPSKLWEYTKQKFQAYKTQLLYGVGGIAAAGGAWWLWSKYGTTNSITSPLKSNATFAPNPRSAINRPSTFAVPGGR